MDEWKTWEGHRLENKRNLRVPTYSTVPIYGYEWIGPSYFCFQVLDFQESTGLLQAYEKFKKKNVSHKFFFTSDQAPVLLFGTVLLPVSENECWNSE